MLALIWRFFLRFIEIDREMEFNQRGIMIIITYLIQRLSLLIIFRFVGHVWNFQKIFIFRLLFIFFHFYTTGL